MKKEYTLNNIPKDMEMFYSDYYGYDDGYFSEIEELEDYCKYEGIEIPKYIYGTTSEKLHMDACDIVDILLEEWYEDAIYNVDDNALKEFQKACDKFCKDCGVGDCYTVDYDTIIYLRKED